ncbi:Helicase [candidate division TM7 genomosp. GTL1]|nr:Helicase [candidate division TM7 genomosp. GTL1]
MKLDFTFLCGTLVLAMDNITSIKYCLYARKSSEQDERQAMSIDSQIKEMRAMAERDGLNVVAFKQESFSAKESGKRPVFNEILIDLRTGQYNGILTWAADRLSRNAGDLGSLVDLMDEHGKFYLVYNKPESSQNGDFPGTVFTGSSNMTYRGLVGQGELNDSHRDKSKFKEYEGQFKELWDSAKSIAIADSHNKDEFIKELKARIWKYQIPSPHEMYIRVLHEVFNQEEREGILSPSKITNGQFTDLEYQLDAVRMGIERLEKYDGVIVADVVGLGKSVIASCIARNLDMNTVIIAPPHLMPQWEDYKEQFGIRGSRVYSSGSISQVYERYKDSNDPILIILDEAHRYRNEDTNDYKLLHQVCRSHPNNKILVLTATPFNNAPKDVFALVKLFQTPGQATIRSVDNLSLRFRELIDRYKKLRRIMAKGVDQELIDKEAEEIAIEQRRLIESVIIRRSRLDLKQITRYRDDLARQGIDFAEVVGPELMEYDLGNLLSLYLETLNAISAPTGGRGLHRGTL